MILTHFTEDDPMPSPIPARVRQVILQRSTQGESVANLAEELQLSPRTVRHLVQRFAQRGPEGVAPDYSGCATKKLPTDSAAFRKALAMRQQHPMWGGGLIHVLLNEKNQACPSVRTLQRWFRRNQLAPRNSGLVIPMKFGRWMPWTSCVWGAAKK